MLFLEDLHWAGTSTIDVLCLMAGKFDALGVLVVIQRPSDLLLLKHPFLQIKPDPKGARRLPRTDARISTRWRLPSMWRSSFPATGFRLNSLLMADLVRYLRYRSVTAQTNGRHRSCTTAAGEIPRVARC